jgi:N-acetylglucosaminyldiphosphoundecaprenol N-acetyl-beta-D-mannosaminyltransferase
MACGTPVVCSNASSLPEIGGDAVLTFEPYHIEDIRDKLLLVLQNQELRSEMIAKGFLQIEKFSWKKHAEKIIEEFEKNAKKSVHSRLTHLQEFEKKIYREEKPYLNQLEILKKFIKSFFLKGFHHFIEILISLFVSLFLLPIHLIYICLQMVMKRSIFKEHVFFGKDAKPLPLKLFHSKSTLFNRSALFWYVNIGKMNLIGPSLKPYSEQERETGDAYLFQLKPGIVDLWFIRQSSRTGFEGRFETEKEYFATSRPLKDFFLLFQSLPSLLFHQETEKSAEKLEIFDIPIMNITMEQSLEMIQQDLQQENFKRVYFLNPDCLNKSLSDKDYKEILLNQSDYLFADGIGIVIASKLLGNPLIGNVNGTDLFPFLCQVAEKEAYRLFFLGAKPGIPEQLTENLLKRYPNLIIAGSHHGYFNHQTESKSIIKQILTAKPDVLFVAFGAPAQEKWITEHINELKEHPIVVLGVGGLFDFYSETKKRAPRWMRQIGLEWVFRLLIEPKRMWKRYILGNPYFLYQVMIYKLSKRRK